MPNIFNSSHSFSSDNEMDYWSLVINKMNKFQNFFRKLDFPMEFFPFIYPIEKSGPYPKILQISKFVDQGHIDTHFPTNLGDNPDLQNSSEILKQ